MHEQRRPLRAWIVSGVLCAALAVALTFHLTREGVQAVGRGLPEPVPGVAAPAPQVREASDAPERGGRRALVVLDGTTGQPVAGALVFRRRDPAANLPAHLSSLLPDSLTASGPAFVADSQGRASLDAAIEMWWVLGEGFAWRPVAIPEDAAPEPVEIRLAARGGRVRIAVEGWRSDAGLHVFALQGGAAVCLPDPDDSGYLDLPGMPVGEHQVEVRRGRWYWMQKAASEPLATGRIRVQAGLVTSLTLEVGPLPIESPVRVRLELAAAKEWPLGRSLVTWQGLDAGIEDVRMEDRLGLSADGSHWVGGWHELPPGMYELGVYSQDWFWRGRRNLQRGSPPVEAALPGAAEVRVRVAWPDGRDVQRVATVLWTSTQVNGDACVGSAEVGLDGAELHLAVPEGDVRLVLRSPEALEDRLELGRLSAGQVRTVSHVMRPAGGIDIDVSGGAASLEGVVVWIDWEEEGLPETSLSTREMVAGRPIELRSLRPGRYVVHLSAEGRHTRRLENVLVEAGKVLSLSATLPLQR